MIEVSGTGPQAKTTFQTWAAPAGFYAIGALISTIGIPAGPASLEVICGKDIDALGFIPRWVVSNPSQNAPDTVVHMEGLYLAPGDLLEFKVSKFNFGANPDADWTIQLYVFASAEIAQS